MVIFPIILFLGNKVLTDTHFLKELLEFLVKWYKVALLTSFLESLHEYLALIDSLMPPNLCEYLFDSLLIDFGHEPGEVVVLVAKF